MSRTMRAIIVKEFRENLRWAGLIFLITSGLLALGLSEEFNSGMSILGNTFLTLCPLMYPAAGLALGLIQIFQDARKGRWQFIAHRPVSRGQLLAGKVIVGIGLYIAATLVPLAIVTLWVSMPGHVPGPFSLDMAEPALAYLIAGLMWYAGGLLVAARKARWIGSRIVPLGGALLGSLLIQVAGMTIWDAIGISLVFSALLLVAVWGVFIAGGNTSRSPWWSKPLIGSTLFFGWGAITMLAAVIGGGIIQMVLPSSGAMYQLYRFNQKGELRLWTYDAGQLEKIEDLSGHSLPITNDDVNGTSVLPETTLFFAERAFRGRPDVLQAQIWGFLKPENHVLTLLGGDGNWFYVSSRRTVEGYNVQTRRYLGSVGPDGFAGPDKPAQAFSGSLPRFEYFFDYREGLLPLRDSVYRLDLLQRQAVRIFTAPPGDSVVTAGLLRTERWRVAGDHDQRPDLVAIATQKSLYILQGDRLSMTVPIDYDHLDNDMTVGRTNSGQIIVAYDREIAATPSTYSIYEPDGTLVRRADLPPPVQPPDNVFDDIWQEIAALSLTPQILSATVFAIKKYYARPEAWSGIAILGGFAAGYAGAAFGMLRMQHASRRQMWIWVPLAGLLGVIGLLLLVSMREKVVAVRCPSCGKRRLLNELECPHCHAGVEPPTMQGIEIFEPMAVGS